MERQPVLRGATAAAIQHHYDVSNDFYRLWLDPEMLYSAAMWDADDDLPGAQLRKMDYHAAQARAAGKPRVLDIGCGWGAVLRRLVGTHRVGRAVGLTLSEAQAQHARALAGPQIEVRVEDWAVHRPEAHYDAIISIGAFEHFARVEFSDSQKVAAYRQFFATCQEWLNPGGYLSLQTFAYNGRRPRAEAVTSEATRFLASEIFRETDPPRTADIFEAMEGTFEVVTMRNDRDDYARTCRVWMEGLTAHREAAREIVGPETLERYERYLAYSYIGFKSGNLALLRLTLRAFEKPRFRGSPPLQSM